MSKVVRGLGRLRPVLLQKPVRMIEYGGIRDFSDSIEELADRVCPEPEENNLIQLCFELK
jgi:hypothetical protein